MSVLLTWSTTNGGSAISEEVDNGDCANGATSSVQTIYLRHDGLAEITNCRIYLAPFTGTYDGDATPVADHQELLDWGDGATAGAFGGFQVNFNAAGGFPAGNWPTLATKTPTNGFVARTGTADRSDNAVTLPVATGCSSAGVIPVGLSPNVRFQYRVVVPTDEDTVGVRMWDLPLLYTFTS